MVIQATVLLILAATIAICPVHTSNMNENVFRLDKDIPRILPSQSPVYYIGQRLAASGCQGHVEKRIFSVLKAIA